MLRDGQSKLLENMTKANPLAAMPGMEAMRAQQEAFVKAMTGGFGGLAGTGPKRTADDEGGEDLDEIRKQLAELQAKLSQLGK
jgi:polyhydroxyalkanoate synthesis regulator protein